MQWSALVGGFIVLFLLATMGQQMISGGGVMFFSPLALIWVVGGTAGLLLLSHPLERFIKLGQRILHGFRDGEHREELTFLQQELVQLLLSVRRSGKLVLEPYAERCSDDLLRSALEWTADADDEAAVAAWLPQQTQRLRREFDSNRKLLSQAFSTAIGLGALGFLAGLLLFAARLDIPTALADGSAIVDSMKLAALSLAYGIGLALVVIRPLLARVDRTLEMEYQRAELIGEAMQMIYAEWPPNAMRRRLQRLAGEPSRKTTTEHNILWKEDDH